MIVLRIFLIIFLFSASKVFAQLPERNFHIVPVENSSKNLNAEANLFNDPNYSIYQDPASPVGADYYSNSNQNIPPEYQNSENLFDNPNYVPQQDPALFENSDMPDQAPNMVIQSEVPASEISNDASLVKPHNPRAAMFLPQKQTPSRLFSADLSKPETFVNSNNLIRKTGSFYQARGEVIAIEGKVTDSFGLPIEGAIIEIWQTNAAGKYQNLLDKNSRFLDVFFNMSGRAITDNLGNYSFLTIMPGSYLDRAPHININIYHKQFGRIETEFYFDKHPRNDLDYVYLSYNETDRKLLTAIVELANPFDKESHKRSYFNIVMNGVHKYKSFGSSF